MSVYVKLPYFQVNHDETLEHKYIPYYHSINLETLTKISKDILNIESDELNFDDITELNSGNDSVVYMISLLTNITKQYKDFCMNERYFTDEFSSITFDAIREYHNDPETGILNNIVECNDFYSNYPLEEYNTIREKTNDTDYNRIQYALEKLTRTLLFTQDRKYYSLDIIVKGALILFKIAKYSIPVDGYGKENIALSYISYAIDCVVRTRTTQHWLNDNYKKDLINYKSNHLLNTYKLETPKERANAMIATISQEVPIIKKLSYDSYIDLMNNKYSIIVNNNKYYVFDENVILDIFKMNEDVILEISEKYKTLVPKVTESI